MSERSKRLLLRLVNEGHVRGWDDRRMPTISAIGRRGFPAGGIRDFAVMIGVARADNVVGFGQLGHAVRGVLNRTAQRRFGVLDPLKIVIENYALSNRAPQAAQGVEEALKQTSLH